MSGKKEILNENVIGVNWEKLKSHHDFLPSIYKAMDEYAEQQSIAFLDWVDGKSYVCDLHTDDNEKIWCKYGEKGNKSYTTKELYQLFIKQNP